MWTVGSGCPRCLSVSLDEVLSLSLQARKGKKKIDPYVFSKTLEPELSLANVQHGFVPSASLVPGQICTPGEVTGLGSFCPIVEPCDKSLRSRPSSAILHQALIHGENFSLCFYKKQ